VGNRKVSYLIIFNKLNYFYYHFNYTFLERKSLAFTISSWSSSTRSHPLDIYSKEKAYDGNVFDNIFEYAETDNEGLKYFMLYLVQEYSLGKIILHRKYEGCCGLAAGCNPNCGEL